MLGATFMIVAMTLLPVGDAAGKYLSSVAPYAPATMAWIRFVMGAVLLAPVALFWVRRTRFDRFFAVSQLMRGALLSATIGLILAAVSRIPMADAFGAFFIGPAVSTLLARILLRETVTRWEWGALALGFVGVLLVTRPGATMEIGTIYGLGAGCCYGSYLTATRWTAASAPPVMALFSQLVVGTVLLAPAGVPELMRFGVVEPGLLCLLALPSMAANLLAILAYRFSRASALAPLVYVQILCATAIGYWVFGDLPDAIAAAGLALIMGSGLLMLWRSRMSA